MQEKVARKFRDRIYNRVTQHIEGGRKAISLRFDPKLLKLIDTLAKRLRNTNRNQLLEEGARLILERNGVDPDKAK